MAIVSSYKNRAIDDKIIAFGEVGLSGEVRAVSMTANRIQEAKKLGFNQCVIPRSCLDGLAAIEGIKVIGVEEFAQVVDYFSVKDNLNG